MLGLLWFLYTAFGLISRAISPLVTPILRDLNMSYSQMGLILGAWQLTYIAVAAISGTIIDKWGVRKSILAGILIIALSSILRYFPHGFGTMLFAVALFGVGGPMISIGCPKTISLSRAARKALLIRRSRPVPVSMRVIFFTILLYIIIGTLRIQHEPRDARNPNS